MRFIRNEGLVDNLNVSSRLVCRIILPSIRCQIGMDVKD